MENMETKEFKLLTPFTVKDYGATETPNEDIITIHGWASWAGADGAIVSDLAGDVVCPEGVDTTLWSANPQILMQHDRNKTIGRGITVDKRPEGLYITAIIHKEACDSQDFYRIKSGLIDRFSIGFSTRRGEWRKLMEKETWFITECVLMEVSCVSLPCCPQAAFSVIKALPDGSFTSEKSVEETEVKKEDITETTKEEPLMNIKVKRADLLSAEDVEAYKSLGGNEAEEVEMDISAFVKGVVAQEVAALLAAKEKEAQELAEKAAQEAEELAQKQAEEAELEAKAADEAAKVDEEAKAAEEISSLKEIIETIKSAIVEQK